MELLKRFAHAIAPGPTRAVVDAETGSLTVFAEHAPVNTGAVVVAHSPKGIIVGYISYPAPGWVQIDETAYPDSRLAVRGPVVFTVSPLEGECMDQGGSV